MVRVNLITPAALSDQHLIAEYDEILMLIGYVRRYPLPLDIPNRYSLGKGHMKFFKDKLIYLKKRHETLKVEMRKRNFETNVTIDLSGFDKDLKNDWTPNEQDKKIIKQRIIEKIMKKPDYYRYYGKYKSPKFFIELIKKSL